MNLDTTYSRTNSGLNHTGTFGVTCSQSVKKIEWNAGSNQNMCETGLKFTNVGEEIFNWTHKVSINSNVHGFFGFSAHFVNTFHFSLGTQTLLAQGGGMNVDNDYILFTADHRHIHMIVNIIIQFSKFQTTWTSAYDKMDHEMTFKCGFERFRDCDFKLTYDFTQPKKTVGLTWFTNPRYPVDFKAEAEMGENMRAMVELSTPFDDYKLMKSTVEVNKATQPWNVSMESQFNDMTMKTEGTHYAHLFTGKHKLM